MFYEFANYLLSQNERIDNDIIQVFQNDGFKLFKYLNCKLRDYLIIDYSEKASGKKTCSNNVYRHSRVYGIDGI
jgi:type VI protein secretion system component Hcp